MPTPSTSSFASRSAPAPRRVIVLGSTGSIGVNALKVIAHLNITGPDQFEIVGLAAGSNAALLAQQAREFSVLDLALASTESPQPQSSSWPTAARLRVGPDSALELVQSVDADLVLAAVVGSAGLPAVVAAIKRGCDIALANKETLVAAGALVVPLAQHHDVRLLPVDSEHSAIFQCLAARAPHSTESSPRALDADTSHIRRIILTASGGPFRTWPRERIASATVEQALNHPTWSMGAKITIDSASMMNKALELIEAHWLFGLQSARIDVLIHPQSVIHGLVEFVDGSILAQMGPPDMKTPIQVALTWPRRAPGAGKPLDWQSLSRLDFESPDPQRFPAINLARRALALGGAAGAILNAANEEAVRAFLDHRIPFGRITEIVAETLDSTPITTVRTLDDVLATDAAARVTARNAIDQTSTIRTPSHPAHAAR